MSEPGFWERGGRSPALGALISTTLIVALYSLAGNVVMLAYMLTDMRGFGAGDWVRLRHGVIDHYRVPILALTMLFEFLFFGLGTFALFRRWHGVPLRERFRIRVPSPAVILFAVIGAAGLFPLALYAGEAFSRAFPFLRELEKSGGGLVAATSPGAWVFVIAAICVTPALFEEFLFRGYLQGTLSRGVRSPWSWLLPGGFFALVHQNYIGFGALLVIGVYLAYVFDTGGSIWPGSLVHFLYNGGIVVLANLNDHAVLPWAFGSDGLTRPAAVAAALPLAAAGIAGLAWVKRRRTSARSRTHRDMVE